MINLNLIDSQESDLLAFSDDSQDSSSISISSLAVNDDIFGTDGPDLLFGTPGDDTIFALAGDDTIIGSIGNDTIFGDEGFDTVDYSDFDEAVTILTAGNFDDGGETLLVNVENIIGAEGEANAIDGSSVTEGSTSLNVNLGNNSLIVEDIPGIGSLNIGVENFVNVFGTSNDDVIVGDAFANNLVGNDGNDTLDGGARNDLLDGGDGEDVLLGGNGKDTLNGGTGNDFLDGGASDDELSGFDGDDTLDGSFGRDTLNGGFGNDFLDGGTSDDLLLGFDGDDILVGGNGRDTLDGGIGNDFLTGGNSPDTFVLSAETGSDVIADFDLRNDAIGLSGGITFEDLSFSGSDIVFNVQTLATLNGVDTTTLTENNFDII